MSDTKRSTCPYCGLVIIASEAARTIFHQAPECRRFAELCQRAGKDVRQGPVHGRDVEAHIEANARLVRQRMN